MPFNSEQVLARLLAASQSDRLAHAYLLRGTDRGGLERLAIRLAAALVGGSLSEHPDIHLVRPESKSRRIRIEQIRELEKNLQLKSYHGGRKIALICEGERMCLGGADAANAFLKTLEEPPTGTIILLTSAEPQLMLPTILSRCVQVAVHEGALDRGAISSVWGGLLKEWFGEQREGPLRAYRRSTLLWQTWQNVREEVEARLEEAMEKSPEADEEVSKAAVEAEVVLGRKQSIAALQTAYWEQERTQRLESGMGRSTIFRTIRILEDLSQSLLQNVEPLLAVERTCLLLEGVVVEGM